MNIERTNIELLAPHYSTKLFRAYYEYMLDTNRKFLFEEICSELGIQLEFLLADDNWVSNEFTNQFIRKLKEKTSEQRIAYNVGKFTLSPSCINQFEFALIKTLPPFLFFFSLPAQSKKINRFHNFNLTKCRPGKIKIQISPKSKEASCEDFDDNVVGVIEGIKAIHEFTSLDVSCVNNDGTHEISIAYRVPFLSILKNVVFLLVLSFGVFVPKAVAAVLGIEPTASQSIVFLVTYYLCLISGGMITKFMQAMSYNFIYHKSTQKKAEEIYAQKVELDRRYHEANLLKELAYKLSGESDPGKIIEFTLDDLEKRFNFFKSMVMLVNDKRERLKTFEVRGFEDGTLLKCIDLEYPAPKSDPQVFSNILDEGKTVNINLEVFKKVITPSNLRVIEALGVSSIVASPIVCEGVRYGLLIIGSVDTDNIFSKNDEFLIDQITKMLSLSFDKASSFKKEKTLRSVFQKYVPAEVLESLDIEGSGKLVTKNIHLTSMFVDLRGFTKMSEKMAPEDVVSVINTYCSFVTKRAAEMGGVIDNIVGDGLVIFFPACAKKKVNHALNALLASVRILADISIFHEELRHKGIGPLAIGIGLHSGVATVGSVGSDNKLNYTAIGDTVNLASRIEAISKKFLDTSTGDIKGNVLFSSAVLRESGLSVEFFINLGLQRVRGRELSVELYMMDYTKALEIDEDLELTAFPSVKSSA